MIKLINRDLEIYNIEYRIIDILEEYQRFGQVEITTNTEGLCLNTVGFYQLLDYVCDKFLLDKSKIIIHTLNSLEKHDRYQVITHPNHFILNKQFNNFIPNSYVPFKSEQLRTVGCFVGRPSWTRLILISWLFDNFKEKCLLTCNYTESDSDKAYLRLDEVNFYDSKNLEQAVLFLKHTPLTLDNNYDKTQELTDNHKFYTSLLNLLNYYDQIFLDLVTETYVMGNTFFPTEKTTRPIVAKTPFIVMGPRNYLDNLKKMGFQTFNRWWDESYDDLEGAARVDAIKNVINRIMSWPQDHLQLILSEMQETLVHNSDLIVKGAV